VNVAWPLKKSDPFMQESEQQQRPRRAWWQFNLRTMLVMLALAGFGSAWWRDHFHLSQQLKLAQDQLNGLGMASWSTQQVVGAPNTSGAGDIPTAWASATQDGQKEWLRLTYKKSVRPTIVEIHETYNPGSVTKVTAFDWRGNEVVIWSGKDPTPTTAARGISRIPVKCKFKTNEIRIYLDSDKVPGWNEIDAVGLVSKGKTQWADTCSASSCYASRSGIGFGLAVPGQPVTVSGSNVVITRSKTLPGSAPAAPPTTGAPVLPFGRPATSR
jgi:hypothetical protein